MADPHVITTLRAKRAELAGEVKRAEALIAQLQAQITGLDSALRTFDPNQRPHTIRARVKRRTESTFRGGQLIGAIVAVLRTAKEPMPVRDLAMAVAAARGVDLPTQAARSAFVANVRAGLKRPRPELVKQPAHGARGGFVWSLVDGVSLR